VLLTAGLYACKVRHTAVPTVNSSDTIDYKKGMDFWGRQSDSAFYYFNKVVTNSKDSLQIAWAYNTMAIIQSDAGDYYGGQESLLLSLKYLNEQKKVDQDCLIADYNELGTSSSSLKNYDAAIDYYDQALKFSKDNDSKTIALNNQAVTYQKMGRYAQAIAIYQSIIGQSKKNTKEYARVLSNLAKVRWLQNPRYLAAPDLLMALQIRKNELDEWGLNASYAHLSDYYSHSNTDSALFYANKMYFIAQRLNSPDDQLEALEKLISLSPPKALKQYFKLHQSLNDSIQTTRSAAKNQFALIRYEAQKSKADNLRLQKDNTEKKVQIIKQQAIIYAILGFSIGFACVFTLWYRKRKQRMEWESRNVIREQQLKLSQKVHDVVANGLYHIMTRIEHQDFIKKDQLLDGIEALYEQSRDISYEKSKDIRSDFQVTIADLLTSFASDTIKVLVVGNHKGLWNSVKDSVKIELKHMLLELMVNMKKHSSARNVIVKFERQDNNLKVQYTDDGFGLPSSFQYGNGLTNTGNRIKGIGGRVIFDKTAKKGLKIQIYLPIP
jgi:tetratricopeptide (TPR) repeat protein